MRCVKDARAAFLLAWMAWGFLFFSVSRNKLPGYLLPLLPAVAALIGIAVAETKPRAIKIACLFAVSAALLLLIPAIQEVLPQALVSGLSHTEMRFPLSVWVIPALLVTFLSGVLEWKGRRECAVAAVALLTTIAVVRLVSELYPELDRQASARSQWRSSSDSITCVSNENRTLRYGLSYYAGRDLPDCN